MIRHGTGSALPDQARMSVGPLASTLAAGNTSGQAPPARTAAMNASLTSTERLKWRSWPARCLAATKASISGWSQRSVAIMAPRRAPVDRMVPHMASHTCMNETGPEAMLPTPLARTP